jgi:hypothetical protein
MKRRFSKRRKMRGGSYTEADKTKLNQYGFTPNQITILEDMDISLSSIESKREQIASQQPDLQMNGDDFNELVVNALMDDNLNFQDGAPVANDQMNIDELDVPMDVDMEGYTTDEPLSQDDSQWGGIKRKNRMQTRRKKRTNKKLKSNAKRQHSKRRANKNKTVRRKRSGSRKHRGGGCYGHGAGANASDPNISVYNSKLPTLFPYKA